MTMSHDRVRFKIPRCRLEGSKKRLLLEAITNTLGVYPNDVRCKMAESVHADVHFICRPSQFARFLILRHEMGIPNGFAELHAELFVPKTESTYIDASKNSAKHC